MFRLLDIPKNRPVRVLKILEYGEQPKHVDTKVNKHILIL
jgi:hypothetical protein